MIAVELMFVDAALRETNGGVIDEFRGDHVGLFNVTLIHCSKWVRS